MVFENSPDRIEMSTETIERTPPALGGTLIIMQRHGDYDRSTGHLTEEGRENALERSSRVLEGILEQIPEGERKKVKILVVASPTIRNEGRRSMETASAIIESAKRILLEHSIPEENLLTDTPRAEESIEEPRMLNDDSGFRKFLADKYGEGTQEFWRAYEEEIHEDERVGMGAEGPVEMSDRFAHFTNVLARYARQFHSKHKDNPERLIIWNVSHYDTVTTYFKNHVAGIPQKNHVPVDYDGGISLLINPDNEASVTFKGTNYPVELPQRGHSLS